MKKLSVSVLLLLLINFGCKSEEDNIIEKVKNLVVQTRYEDALEILNVAIKKYPDSSKLYVERGSILYTLIFRVENNFLSKSLASKALDDFQNSIRIKPTFDGYIGLGNVYGFLHDPVLSERSYKKAQEYSTTDEMKSIVQSNLGMVYLSKKNYDDALVCFYKSQLYDNNLFTHLRIGDIKMKKGEKEYALKIWVYALSNKDVKGSFTVAHEVAYKIALVYYDKREYDKSLHYTNWILEKDESNSKALSLYKKIKRKM